MPLSYLRQWIPLLYLLLGGGCAEYHSSANSLDYLEFHDPGGWSLRIDGDGSGRLKCRAYPKRTVHYTPATFIIYPISKKFLECGKAQQFSSPACLRAVYFHAGTNTTSVCNCPEENWAEAYFEQAFRSLRHNPGDTRALRLIKRHWLHDPPMLGGSWAARQ